MTPADARPITIDIDSLLVGSSLTSECLVEAVRRHPAIVLRLPFWAMRGKAVLRQRLAKYAELDVAALPYRAAAIEEVRRGTEERHVVLVTTAEPVLARRVAEHLGIAEVQTGQGSAAPGPPVGWRWITRALRPYQWLKNALVFVPFLLSHRGGRRREMGRRGALVLRGFPCARRPDMS